MEKFRRELKSVKRFEVSYYVDLVDTIERYVKEKPDISIETCKALLEGLSKLILGELEQTPESYFQDIKLSKLFKEARNCLSKKISKYPIEVIYDDNLVDEFGSIANILSQLIPSGAITRIGIIRNDHGDISHGRSSLKNQVNDEDLAEFVIGITDTVCTYMLRKLDQITDKVLQYKDNPKFNEYLDELYPLDGKTLYSKALFDQEFETYEIQLGDYIIENNPEE